MPRGGSRKGERRGGAKPGKRGNPALVKGHKLATGRPKGAKSKPLGAAQRDQEVVAILNNPRFSPGEREERLETYFQITGRRIRMPREVMLDAMRFFEDQAVEYHEIMTANMDLAAQAAAAENREAQALYDQHVAAAEAKLNQSLGMAVDVAYKVAPFCHPRLAAVVTNPAGGAENPFKVLQLLMQDLDEAGRTPRFIDHDANEGAR